MIKIRSSVASSKIYKASLWQIGFSKRARLEKNDKAGEETNAHLQTSSFVPQSKWTASNHEVEEACFDYSRLSEHVIIAELAKFSLTILLTLLFLS